MLWASAVRVLQAEGKELDGLTGFLSGSSGAEQAPWPNSVSRAWRTPMLIPMLT